MKIDLKKFANKYKLSMSKVQLEYPNALKIAKDMGKETDEDFIEDSLKYLLDIKESSNLIQLANKYLESENFDKFYEEITSAEIPQKLRPEKIAKNVYNFPNDEWNKSKDKRDVYKYIKNKKNESSPEPEADSVPFQPPLMVSNY